MTPFEKWLHEKGIDKSVITDAQRKLLGKEYVEELKKGRSLGKIVNK